MPNAAFIIPTRVQLCIWNLKTVKDITDSHGQYIIFTTLDKRGNKSILVGTRFGSARINPYDHNICDNIFASLFCSQVTQPKPRNSSFFSILALANNWDVDKRLDSDTSETPCQM